MSTVHTEAKSIMFPKTEVMDVAGHGIYEGPGTNALWIARNYYTGLVKWLSS